MFTGNTRWWFSKLLWTSLFSQCLIHSFLMSLALLLPLKASIWSAWTSQIGTLLSCEKITYTFRIVTLLPPNSITFPTDIFLNLKSDFSWDVQNCTIKAQIKPEALFFFPRKYYLIFQFSPSFHIACSSCHVLQGT